MKPLLALLLSTGLLVIAFAPDAQAATAKRTTSSSSASRRRPPSRAAAIQQAKGKKKHSNVKVKRVYVRRMVHGRWVRVSRVVRVAGPTGQQHPDAERYRQIQQALANRGFFKGEVNGQWNADSVDAMKRFQSARNISPDGKINALSLIGLGLGPKHDGNVAAAPPPPPAPTATPQ